MKRWFVMTAIACCCACGMRKDYVRSHTTVAFHNASSVAAHVKGACESPGEDTTHCEQSSSKLVELCQRLSELNKEAEGRGFDCEAWKEVRQ
jgi:hypothetical protein